MRRDQPNAQTQNPGLLGLPVPVVVVVAVVVVASEEVVGERLDERGEHPDRRRAQAVPHTSAEGVEHAADQTKPRAGPARRAPVIRRHARQYLGGEEHRAGAAPRRRFRHLHHRPRVVVGGGAVGRRLEKTRAPHIRARVVTHRL